MMEGKLSSDPPVSSEAMEVMQARENKDNDGWNMMKTVRVCSKVNKAKCTQFCILTLWLTLAFVVGTLVGIAITLSTQRASRNNTNNDNILVGSYYYPWYGNNNFHDSYLRNQLNPPQYPLLGEYDDTQPEIILQHLKWSQQANIGIWITSWWGPGDGTDTTTREVIMEHNDLGDMKIAIHYETGRILDVNDTDTMLLQVESEIKYLCENYFHHPSYFRIDSRPVIVVYLTRVLEDKGVLEDVVWTMRSAAEKWGHVLYIIGDHSFGNAPSGNQDERPDPFIPFKVLDAVTNYDVYGSMSSPTYYAGTNVVDSYYQKQNEWRKAAIEHGCGFIPSVSPGFNDRGVRLQVDHQPLSRKLDNDSNSEQGSFFTYSIEMAKKLVDPMVENLLFVTSFNEWHEDTQIEPCTGNLAVDPPELTGGLEYTGYGELFLDLLRDGTKNKAGSKPTENIVDRG